MLRGRKPRRRWNYTTVLNIVFLAVAALLVVRFLGLDQAVSVGASDACRH